jgi:methionyl-tRNA formyltransferase
VRAVLVGAVESSRVVLGRIAQAPGWTPALVLTLPLEKSGRHSDFVDLSASASEAGCALARVDNVNSDEAIARIEEANADYIFVAGWSQICGPRFREAARDRAIGYHPAALPRLRGRAVIPWTILNQEPITAGTLFWIDEGVDSGPIFAQEFFHVAPDETAASLYAKHMDALERMTDRALELLQSPLPPRIAQDERLATWAARRRPSDGAIDWNKSAPEIERQVRALGGPYPAAWTFEGTHMIEVKAARISLDGARFAAAPGQVVSSDASEFSVKCGDGMILAVTDWSHSDERAPKPHIVLANAPLERPISSPKPPMSSARCDCGKEFSHV